MKSVPLNTPPKRVLSACALASCITLAGCDQFGGVRARVYPTPAATIDEACLQKSLGMAFGPQAVTREYNPHWFRARVPIEERSGRPAHLDVSARSDDRTAVLEVQWTWDNFTPTNPEFATGISVHIGTTIRDVMKRCTKASAYAIRCQVDAPEKYVVPCPVAERGGA